MTEEFHNNNRMSKRGKEWLKVKRLKNARLVVRMLILPVFVIGFGIRFFMPTPTIGLYAEYAMMVGFPVAYFILSQIYKAQVKKARATPPPHWKSDGSMVA